MNITPPRSWNCGAKPGAGYHAAQGQLAAMRLLDSKQVSMHIDDRRPSPGLDQLPIFPLRTVLFPGIPLRLHIFEPRYKKLLQDCIDNGSPFGVCLIARGQEAHGPLPEPRRVGCTATIRSVQPQDDGRSHLMAVGRKRFRVLKLDRSHVYLRAVVEKLPMPVEAQSPPQLARPLSELLPRYLDRLQALDLWQGDPSQLPTDPLQLAYLCAAVLHVPKQEKQELLELDEPTALLRQLESRLRREIALLRPLADRGAQRLRATSPLN